MKTKNIMSQNKLDKFIENEIFQILNIESLEEIKTNELKLVIAKTVQFFENNGYEIPVLQDSIYNDDLFYFLYNEYKDNLFKELKIQKEKRSALIKKLIESKINITEELRNLVNDLQNNVFDFKIYEFLQSYNKIANSACFRFLVFPLLNQNTSSKNILKTLITPILKVYEEKNKNKVYAIYENYIGVYKQYEQKLQLKNNSYDTGIYAPINVYLNNLFKDKCHINSNLLSKINITNTERRYNFSSRNKITLYFDILNSEEGIASKLECEFSSNSFKFDNKKIFINSLQKGKREINLNASIIPSIKSPVLVSIVVTWIEINGDKKQKNFEIELKEQENINVPWKELNKKNPYSISIIEDINNLYGRNEILNLLIENSNSNDIESFMIFGQKRVGKSSIVKSFKNEIDNNENLIVVYKSMGNLKAIDPLTTFNNLGEYLCDEIIEELLKKSQNSLAQYEGINQIEIPVFNGSLAPLEVFIKKIRRINRKLRFIFILDEFDELNQEFFKPGTIGDTFSINLGKGLNDFKYIGFILVGSENMAFLNWQGMRFNNFIEKRVDTFNKENQYDSFKKIVVEPVYPYIKFSETAVDLIYLYANGNPYFTNLICKKAFHTALKHKDIHIDDHDIETAIEQLIETEGKGRFEHFWSDGINTEITPNKDKISDVRKRILLAFSLAVNSTNDLPSISDVIRKIPKPKEYEISQGEFDRVFKEFFSRKIFYEINNTLVEIKPKIFQNWLCDRGKDLLVEGVADLGNIIKEQELEDKLYISNDEISNFIENISYRGKKIRLKEVRDYISQFGKNSSQRKGFNLLNNLYFVSLSDIQDYFRKIQSQVFKKKEVILKQGVRKLKREKAQIYLFSKYFNENENIADSFKIFSRIDSRKKNLNIIIDKNSWKKTEIDNIIIIEPLIDNVDFFKIELNDFLTNLDGMTEIKISIISIVITTKAKSELNKILRKHSNLSIDTYLMETIDDNSISPYIESSLIFEDSSEANNNFGFIRTIFPSLNKNALLVLFENYCPCRSVPSLWEKTKDFNPLFLNNYGCCNTIEANENNPEKLRTKAFELNTKLSQALNKYIVNFLKTKSTKEDWLNIEIVPKNIVKKVTDRWIEEDQKHSKESYLDFIDYKTIAEKHPELQKKLSIKKENLDWLIKLNILRRDPSHPEKPAPKIEDVAYFEKISNIILKKLYPV